MVWLSNCSVFGLYFCLKAEHLYMFGFGPYVQKPNLTGFVRFCLICPKLRRIFEYETGLEMVPNWFRSVFGHMGPNRMFSFVPNVQTE